MWLWIVSNYFFNSPSQNSNNKNSSRILFLFQVMELKITGRGLAWDGGWGWSQGVEWSSYFSFILGRCVEYWGWLFYRWICSVIGNSPVKPQAVRFDKMGMTLQISESWGRSHKQYLLPANPSLCYSFNTFFSPRGLAKTLLHFKRCYGKFPGRSFLSCGDKCQSLQKSGLLTWKPNNWFEWMGKSKEAAHKGNPFWLHLSR